MNITSTFTTERVYLEQPVKPMKSVITLSPSSGSDLLDKYKCTVITIYSKEKSNVFLVDTNISFPTSLGDGLISEIDYDQTDGYLKFFDFNPIKDAVYKLGCTEFQRVTKAEYDAMVTANDYTLFLYDSPNVYIYGVYDASTGTYRYFERVSNSGVTMNNFTERELEDFYTINAKEPSDTFNTTFYLNFVYKSYSEKSLIVKLNSMVNSQDYDNVCKDECNKCGSLSDEIQAFVALQTIYCLNLDTQFINEEFSRAEKLINLLKTLSCCNNACSC